MKIIAIHQPNFFPWLGYFDKIRRADKFVLLDNVQFPKTGGNWSNRVKLIVGGHPQWVTMPIIRSYHGVRTYRETIINNSTGWREKFLRTLTTNYGKSPYFKEVFPFIESLALFESDNLAEFNIHAIKSLVRKLDLPLQKLVEQSSLPVSGTSTDLLISCTLALGGTAYLCGMGASGYQQDQNFSKAGIQLIYQNFRHPEYDQNCIDGFVPGLSIIDALMNCGFAGTVSLLKPGMVLE